MDVFSVGGTGSCPPDESPRSAEAPERRRTVNHAYEKPGAIEGGTDFSWSDEQCVVAEGAQLDKKARARRQCPFRIPLPHMAESKGMSMGVSRPFGILFYPPYAAMPKGGLFMRVLSPDARLYSLPIFPSYWREASAQFKRLPVLTAAALCAAFSVLLGYLKIPVAPNLFILPTFLVTAVFGVVCGPAYAIPYGAACDLIGYFMHPDGGFFPGYTLSSVLAALIFSLFFFRTRITILRIALCKLVINIFVNLLLGSLWSAMLYSKGYYYYFFNSLVKNTLLLPLEVILLVLLFRALLPALAREKLIPPQPTERIPWI